MSPASRRSAVQQVQAQFGVSERRACRLVGVSRSTTRSEPRPRADDAPLRERLCELALEQCMHFTGGVLDLEVILVDFEGNILGRAAKPRSVSPPPAAEPRPLIERLAEQGADEEE